MTAAVGLAANDETANLGVLVDWPERITVPDITFTLERPVMEQIVAQFDPLSGSRASNGIELITGLIHFLDSTYQ